MAKKKTFPPFSLKRDPNERFYLAIFDFCGFISHRERDSINLRIACVAYEICRLRMMKSNKFHNGIT